jgi:hypothetical protein
VIVTTIIFCWIGAGLRRINQFTNNLTTPFGNQEMKNKLSLLLLSFMLMGGLPAFADTVTEDANDNAEMTAEELQEIKDICISIADESGLENDEHSQYVEECVALETMVPDDAEAPMDSSEDVPFDGDEMTDDVDETPESTDS